jgi:hypothetical protein
MGKDRLVRGAGREKVVGREEGEERGEEEGEGEGKSSGAREVERVWRDGGRETGSRSRED